jgi:hypothetical protein
VLRFACVAACGAGVPANVPTHVPEAVPQRHVTIRDSRPYARGVPAIRCRWCREPMPDAVGRATYCSHAHRQAAYRQRRRDDTTKELRDLRRQLKRAEQRLALRRQWLADLAQNPACAAAIRRVVDLDEADELFGLVD